MPKLPEFVAQDPQKIKTRPPRPRKTVNVKLLREVFAYIKEHPDTAVDLLGITDSESYRLFFGGNTVQDLERYVNEIITKAKAEGRAGR